MEELQIGKTVIVIMVPKIVVYPMLIEHDVQIITTVPDV
jgi:hypothetical protein